MAYASGPQDPMGDEYMEDFGLTNEMLTPGFSNIISQGGTSFGDADSIASSNTIIPNEEQKADMQSILDIFQLDEELPDQSDGNDLDEDDEAQDADLEDQRQRKERLRSIYPVLDRLWWTGSEYMVGAAEKLADGSRDRKSKPDPHLLIGCLFPIYDCHILTLREMSSLYYFSGCAFGALSLLCTK